MKYMLMIYNNPAAIEALPAEERDKIFGDVDTIMKELTESGEFVDGRALADHSRTKTVRLRDGALTITDGPYAEAKEQLAGYLTVDCATEERAVEIAGRWPDARYWGMEVRPVMHDAGTEM